VQVFGVPDRRYGEVVCAWIKLKTGERCDAGRESRVLSRADSRTSRCRQHVRFVDQFPMTVTGQDPEVHHAAGDEPRARRREEKTAESG
jgi:fatty-acyl-CoA synthase